MDLFLKGVPFYKGNMHCHSTLSDGCLSPIEVKAFYREKGYDFLAITDHRRLASTIGMEDDLLMLQGIELDYMLATQAVHLIGVGVSEKFAGFNCEYTTPQECIDQIRACGGRAILAHPAWSLNTTELLCSLKDITAAEVYNSVSTIPLNGDRADASVSLDVAGANGAIYNFVAGDDSHTYIPEGGKSWTMVQAKELTRQGIIDALDAGRFYSTQGPCFEQISIEKDILRVRCSPVDTIVFYSNLVWANHRCACQTGQTSAEYKLFENLGETFVRVQIIDAQEKSAWSNPIRMDRIYTGGER